MGQSNSKFARFYKERENLETLETDYGFATYKLHPEFVQLIDVYVIPEERSNKVSHEFADAVAIIGKEAGKKKMITTADIQTNKIERSIMNILRYGFKLDSSDGRLLYFAKEI